jgi:hypothetical protein
VGLRVPLCNACNAISGCVPRDGASVAVMVREPENGHDQVVMQTSGSGGLDDTMMHGRDADVVLHSTGEG